MRDEPRQTQEQSIKSRKSQLFDEQAPVVETGSRTPFKVFLRSTPAAPLSAGAKAALWVAAAMVALLLLAAILKGRGGPSRPNGAEAAATKPG